MSIIDELPGFVLGAVVPGFLQSEAARRNELAQKLSPTLQPPAQPAQQQQGQAYTPEQLKHIRSDQMLTQSIGGEAQQPTEPARAFDQGQAVMQAPQGQMSPDVTQFAPYPTIDQQVSQPSAVGGQPSAVSGQQSGGGGLMDQISRIMSSPLGLGGMGALGAMMLTPRWAGAGGALGNALMGGMQGYERGSALENQRAQTQAQAEYHRQQAEYEKQHMQLEQEKYRQAKTQADAYSEAMGRLRQKDPALADNIALGITKQPDAFDVFLRSHGGDIHETINDPDFQKFMTLSHSQGSGAGTSFGSFRGEMESKGIPFGTEKFNQEWNKRQNEIAQQKPGEQRAGRKEESEKVTGYGRDLDRYKTSDKEYQLALLDENPQRAQQLLAKKKAELAKRHGLTVDPETGAAFGAREKTGKAERPSLDEIFGGGPGG